MIRRAALTCLFVGWAAAADAEDAPISRSYATAANPRGAVAATLGRQPGRGRQRPTGPRGDTFVPAFPADSETAVRALSPFRSSGGSAAPDRLDVVFFANSRPARLTIVIGTDGRSLDARWTDHLRKLFAAFDRDGDGYLNRYELEHIIPTGGIRQIFQGAYYTRANGQPPDMAQVDRDRDGRASFAEFAEYYRELGPAIVTPRASESNGAEDAATKNLFKHLDADGDGKLSEAELKAAERILLKLDADEDECVSTAEVAATPAPQRTRAVAQTTMAKKATVPAAGARPSGQTVMTFATGIPASTVTQLLKRYDRNGDGRLTRTESGFDPSTFARLDTNKDGSLTVSELDAWRTGAPDAVVRLTMAETTGKCATAVATPDGGPWPPGFAVRQTVPGRLVLRVGVQTAEFAVVPPPKNARAQQIKTVLGGAFPEGQMFVQEQDLAGPQNQFLRVVFDAADFDGDGRLTRAEFEKYFDLQASTAELGLNLGYAVRTPNLFQMLDDNQDGRLGVRELRTAWDRMIVLEPAGATAVTTAVLQPSVTFRLTTAAALAAGEPDTNPAVAVAEAARGPIWFRKMDRNGDGDVSRAEFLGPASDFAALDGNGDGLISLDEAAAYEARVRPKKTSK